MYKVYDVVVSTIHKIYAPRTEAFIWLHLHAPPLDVVVAHAACRPSEGLISPLGGLFMQDFRYELPRITIPRTPVNRGKKRGRDPVGCRGPSCSCGALLLTSRFLALPLAFLSLLLPDLLAFLSLVLPDLLALLAPFRVALPILIQIIRRPLALQLLESGLPLSLVGSPVQAISSFRSGPVRGPGCVLAPQLYAAGVQCKTILPGLSSHLVILRLHDVP